MKDKEEYNQQLGAAREALKLLAGEDVDAIEVKSADRSEAPFLARIVSKLSPMVGNLMEQRIVSILDDQAARNYSWSRQDPGFPDAILEHEGGEDTKTGIEIKAWYVLSTEITGRFKESQHLLADKNIDVAIVAWCMSHLVFGKPKILGVLTVPGAELAESRDNHYHNPPEYLIVEPQDTKTRTQNLQQSNVNGFKLQESDSDSEELARVRAEVAKGRREGWGRFTPHSVESQAAARKLQNELIYRSDTNFAKIDRVGNRAVEEFKSKVLESTYLGKTISRWKSIFAGLSSKSMKERELSERLIAHLYESMKSSELKTEIALDSEDVE